MSMTRVGTLEMAITDSGSIRHRRSQCVARVTLIARKLMLGLITCTHRPTPVNEWHSDTHSLVFNCVWPDRTLSMRERRREREPLMGIKFHCNMNTWWHMRAPRVGLQDERNYLCWSSITAVLGLETLPSCFFAAAAESFSILCVCFINLNRDWKFHGQNPHPQTLHSIMD